MLQYLLVGLSLKAPVQLGNFSISLVVDFLWTGAEGGQVALDKAIGTRATWSGKSYTVVHDRVSPKEGNTRDGR